MSEIGDLRILVTDMQAQLATDLDGVQTELGALTTATAAEIQRVNDALAALPNQGPELQAITTQLTGMRDTLHAGLTSARTGIESAVTTLNQELPDTAPPTP